jgi:uncharacterized membrane protein YqjE
LIITIELTLTMKKDLSMLSVAELHEKKKKLTTVYIALGFLMVLAVTALIYLAIRNKNYALIAVAAGSCITFLPGLVSLIDVNKEIKKRNLNN